ncbi:MAG: DUF4363 family protein [Firmicutes bacterium]|jgi:hypothetical protein|nr:DUF4363 family protein [Bacillota bacterium]
MMRRWGSWLIVIGVVIIIIVSGVTAQRYLDRSSGELTEQLEKVGRALDEENWEKGRNAFVVFEKSWDRTRLKWALFTDHLELDNLEMKLARLREHLHTKDKVNGRADYGEALMLLKHIPERARLTLSNIF